MLAKGRELMQLVECSRCDASTMMGWAKNEVWHLDRAGLEYLCPKCIAVSPPTTAAEERVGFERPEPGAQERYDERRKTQPWSAHTFWWIVHNAVAHPLIALIPRKPLFRFHDWTSYKMHGKRRPD